MKQGNLGVKPVETPIEQNHKLCEAAEDTAVDRESYQWVVSRLIYLSHTRPHIAYAVGVVSQYLKGTLGKGILFKKGEKLTLEAYTDVDYARSIDNRRST